MHWRRTVPISPPLRRLTLEVLDLVFPQRCAACDVPGESPFCAVCAETLVPAPTGCPVCGVPQDESLLPALKPRRCPHCRAHPPRFALASAPYLHGGALADAIHRLKYEKREDLGAALAVLFEACACAAPLALTSPVAVNALPPDALACTRLTRYRDSGVARNGAGRSAVASRWVGLLCSPLGSPNACTAFSCSPRLLPPPRLSTRRRPRYRRDCSPACSSRRRSRTCSACTSGVTTTATSLPW